MSASGRAIFLSYASQDAEAARRICDALRDAGLEVWFDQSELRGGEAWDASIRKQIRDCALFVPIISANTQVREEGYFRREWNLATQRTLDMVEGKAFLLPVVIDTTLDANALVPEKFREVQWTHLPEGARVAAFTARVQRLLAGGATALVSAAVPRTARSAPPAPEAPSIAVLPFVNRSHDEEDEYFSDGLADELLNVLAKIRGLRVAARISAFQFKGKNDDIAMIGRKLNVATVLEGSVRKAGNRMRVSVQLVKVADGYHLWSESYDRTLEDIFAVQDDIAQSVVKELRRIFDMDRPAVTSQAGVNAQVKAAVKGRSENTEAYTLYLQGQYFRDQYTREGAAKALDYYQRALALDPDYALAWAGLSRVYCDQAGQDWSPRAEGYTKAREAAHKALALNPDSAEAHIALGWVRRTADWDWKGAEESFGRALELAPANTLALNGAALLAGNLGRLEEAIELFRRAVELDPLNVAATRNLGFYSLACDALDEAETALQRALELKPQGGLTNTWLALVRLAQGRLDDALETAKREVNEVFRQLALSIVHHARGEMVESDAALAVILEKYQDVSSYQIAEAYASRNDADKAFQWLERTYADHDPGVVYVKMDRLMRNLQADRRWPAFLQKIGLAD